MGFWRGVTKTVGYVVDLRFDRWIGIKSLKNTAGYFTQQTKILFKIQKAHTNESFEEAVDRLGLTSEDLQQRSQQYSALVYLFLLFSTLILLYGIYIYRQGNWMGGLMCFSLILYSLSCAFRFHFWNFQIKHQKLGCTFMDWLKFNLKGTT